MQFDIRVYAVTDDEFTQKEEFLDQLKAGLECGVTMVQLREKTGTDEDFIKKARAVKALTDRYNVPLIINDRIDAALAVDAAGVHVGQDDLPASEARKRLGPDKILGVTAKTPEQAKAAEAAGADYLGSGAVFGSVTKADAKPMTMETLRAITQTVSIPVVAIGGIDETNVRQLAGTGVEGAAVVSGLFGQPDVGAAARKLRTAVDAMTRKTVLTIAGSDSSGGAGIQADLKTMTALGVYGMSAITALTAQNTTGVSGVLDVDPAFVEAQLDAVFTDIVPDAIKIGMVSQVQIIRAIAGKLRQYGAGNVVVDPVMVSTSGSRLLAEDAADTLAKELFALAAVITPNIPEAELLYGRSIGTEAEMAQAARMLSETYSCAVLVKGGHQVGTANDVLVQNGTLTWFRGTRIDNPNTHGTGCTLSSAIACGLARRWDVETSVRAAKEYLTKILAAGLDLGQGSGPLDHCAGMIRQL